MQKTAAAVMAMVAGLAVTAGCGGGSKSNSASLWKITAASAVVKTTDPATGSGWDAGGGAPDPKLCITVGTGTRECSPFVSDTFTPTWNFTYTGTFTYAALGDVLVELLDDDVTADDVITDFASGPLQPSGSQAETLTATGDATTGFDSLVITLSPQ